MATLYTQVGILSTLALAVGVGVHSVVDPQVAAVSGDRFDCGLQILAVIGATFCLIASLFHLYRAGIPKFGYPVVNSGGVLDILEQKRVQGDIGKKDYSDALGRMCVLLNKATSDYRSINESRKGLIRLGFAWLAAAGGFLVIAAVVLKIILATGVVANG